MPNLTQEIDATETLRINIFTNAIKCEIDTTSFEMEFQRED